MFQKQLINNDDVINTILEEWRVRHIKIYGVYLGVNVVGTRCSEPLIIMGMWETEGDVRYWSNIPAGPPSHSRGEPSVLVLTACTSWMTISSHRQIGMIARYIFIWARKNLEDSIIICKLFLAAGPNYNCDPGRLQCNKVECRGG